MTDVQALIERIPKAELHLHLEGTLEPELKFELAKRNDVALPYASAEEMRAAYDYHDLKGFLDMYYEGMGVLLTRQDFHDLAMAYFRTAASQGVVYAEVFFDPQAHLSRGVDFATVIGGIRDARDEANDTLGLRTQLIMCFLRDLTAESAMETFEQAMPFRGELVGVGLDSNEYGNPPVKFAEVFERARGEGLHLTMHCDVDQVEAVRNIGQCLHDIGVERIDHGSNCLDDESLAGEIAERGIGLTCCPISNSWVAGGLKAAELKRLLDRGIRATVNSDDPAYFPGYVLENLVAVQEAAGLAAEEIVNLERNAFTI
ncbi:MAG TPA: adenosine deaminase, partial [Actinomycetota bacterium]